MLYNGAIAQLVEQWTENPCVPGSNPGSTTKTETAQNKLFPFFYFESDLLKIASCVLIDSW